MWSISKILYRHKNNISNNIRVVSHFSSSGPNPQIIGDYIKDTNKSVNNDKLTKEKLVTNPICMIDESIGPHVVDVNNINNENASLMTDETDMRILSFDEVPGPKILKKIANIWKIIPAAGPYFKLNGKLKLTSFLFDEYGPVVRVVGPFGGDVVLLDRPEDMWTVFSQEGPLPVRSTFDSLELYRVKHRKFEFSGLLSLQGEEWGKQRIVIERNLLQALGRFSNRIEMACDDLMEMIPKIRNRQDEVPADFEKRLFKWSLECMGHVLFSERLGLLEGYQPPQGEATWLEEALGKATNALASCETGLQVWKLVETPQFKNLVAGCNALDGLVGQYIRQAEMEIITSRKKEETGDKTTMADDLASKTLIKTLLNIEKMKSDDVLTSLLDMLIIGVNSTTSAMSFILYHLARGQRVQNKLYEELRSAMPHKDSPLPPEEYKNLHYLQACIKESLRIVPPIPVISRILPTSIVVDGYKIPHGTVILLATQVSGLKEENFEDAKRYNPERWTNLDANSFHPFAMLPYGYGPRKCIGQAMAELQISMLVAKIFRRFKVEYNYGDIIPKTKLISKPNRSLCFRFIDRE